MLKNNDDQEELICLDCGKPLRHCECRGKNESNKK